MNKIYGSFRYALDGLAYALVTQRNMRIHFLAAFIVVLLCTVTQVSVLETIAVLLSISLVIALELVNTAVEHVVDLVTKEFHPYAKIAKDVAAAAVFVAAANAVAVAYMIFYDKLNPVRWRPPDTLLRPPFLGVLLVGLLCLIVAISGYAVRLRQTKKGERTSGSS